MQIVLISSAMSVKILNIFTNGRSGSDVVLATIDNQLGVLKTKIQHIDQMLHLHNQLPFAKPKIYWSTADTVFMEYIPGISIKQYLKVADTAALDKLVEYICSYFDYCIAASNPKDYRLLLADKLADSSYILDYNRFNTVLPSSLIHGDFTFDNLLYHNDQFYMIDLHPTEFNSVYFDANKLRQDLTSGWFIRDEHNTLTWQMGCNYVYRQLDRKYPNLFNDELYKFMLLRVLPYCNNALDRNFISAEIDKLCK
jgi:hypothetical protein